MSLEIIYLETGVVTPLISLSRRVFVYSEPFSLVNFEFLDTTDRRTCCSVFRYAPRSVVSKNSKLANENVQNN
jgi:hypothetical protein